MTQGSESLFRQCLAESFGTYLLIFFGCGAVHASVLTGAQSGLWQVAVVWGIAVMLAIYTVGAVSGAHLNPAVTAALCVWRGFPASKVAPYILAQVIGAFLAAASLYFLFDPYLKAREQEKHVTRGGAGSEITAMCYGEFFPSPGPLSNSEGPYSVDAHERLKALVPETSAFVAEFLGTLVLAMVVFAVTDDLNPEAPSSGLGPVFIGLTVAALVSVIAPLTQACFNPARDFGPRLFTFFAGWGAIALPGARPTGFLTVYIIAPVLGAITGAGIYQNLLRKADVQADPAVAPVRS